MQKMIMKIFYFILLLGSIASIILLVLKLQNVDGYKHDSQSESQTIYMKTRKDGILNFLKLYKNISDMKSDTNAIEDHSKLCLKKGNYTFTWVPNENIKDDNGYVMYVRDKNAKTNSYHWNLKNKTNVVKIDDNSWYQIFSNNFLQDKGQKDWPRGSFGDYFSPLKCESKMSIG